MTHSCPTRRSSDLAVGDDIYILPLSGVVESLQPLPEQIRRVAGEGTVVRVRNEYVPLLPVREWFHVPGASRLPHESILVLVEADGHKLALQVDDPVGQTQRSDDHTTELQPLNRTSYAVFSVKKKKPNTRTIRSE